MNNYNGGEKTQMNKLAIFDLDGTILDTLEDISRSANYALKNLGFPTYEQEEYKQFIGNGLHSLCKTSLKENATPENCSKMFELYTDYYNHHKIDNIKLFDGLFELLKDLKSQGLLLAVATNKSDSLAKSIVERIAGAGFFNYVCGSKNETYKPDPGVIIEILGALNIPKENAIMIGDSDIDIMTAENAKIQSVFCEWGYGDKNSLPRAEHYVKNTEELKKVLEEFIK